MNRLTLTQTQYDNLSSKDDNTLYLIKNEGKMYRGSIQYINTYTDVPEVQQPIIAGTRSIKATQPTKTTLNQSKSTTSKTIPTDYLCFTANTAESTVELIKIGSPSIANTAYSLDGTNWILFTPSNTAGTNTISLKNAGDKVYFKNDILGNFSSFNHLQFIMTGSIAASGNCNSMYMSSGFEYLTELVYNRCYYKMFYNCNSLTNAPELPATILSNQCYDNMFNNCILLVNSPALPAENLSTYCYHAMFQNCTSLVTAPELPSTTMMDGCYYCMFSGCENLISTPALPATTLAIYCYRQMFDGCISLVSIPNLPATTLAEYCYNDMFANCTSLYISDSVVDEIAEKTLVIPSSNEFNNSFQQDGMFTNCAGVRSSNIMFGVSGKSYTYYTQNTLV